MSRFWCMLVASVIDCVAQICGARVENPHLLIFVSALTGCKLIAPPCLLSDPFSVRCWCEWTCALVGYGFLFGVLPSLLVQVFGINGLSTNWGFMTFAPVISGNIFNILYGNLPPPFSILSIFFDKFFFPHLFIATNINYKYNLSRKDIRFPFDNFARRSKTMLWIDPLLQCSLLGHIRRLSTRPLSQSVEHSIWQRHQSKSRQTRTGERHRKGCMSVGGIPFFAGSLEVGEFWTFQVSKILHSPGCLRIRFFS